MATITQNEDTNVQVIEITTQEMIDALQPLVAAAGGSWPDFEAGEADHSYLKVTDGVNTVHLDQNSAAVQALTLTDKEPGGAPGGEEAPPAA